MSRGGRPVRGVSPRLRFVSESAAVVATARPTGRAGRYTVRFRLPIAGVWTYRIMIRGVVAGTGKIEARIDARLPGADAYAICDDAGPFWPTMTLAIDFGSAWIACKERGTLARFDAGTS